MEDLFSPAGHPDLLVGLGKPDDAAVWRLDDDRALIVTTDFFTPVVDDPYHYGAIAAANSLSDVYAMGGKPFLALNIAAMPPDLHPEMISTILRGAMEKALQAGVVIAGGHTVQDKEPKFGLVALGFVDPRHMLTKSGVLPGDRLVLTKPLGTGTTTTALKRDLVDLADLEEAVDWMQRLNQDAAELASQFNLSGGTDITGFGLLGHAWEMAEASGVGLRFDFSCIPFLNGAYRYAQQFIFPGGSFDNRMFFERHVTYDPRLSEPEQMLLFDAQTSGGLLLAVPPDRLDALLTSAAERNQPIWLVGEAFSGTGIQVTLP